MAALDTLLQITIYSAVIFAVIMLMKVCFKNKISPFLQYAIWGILLLRLMFPATIESSVHLIAVLPKTAVSTEQITQNTQGDAFDFMTPSSGAYSNEQNTHYSEKPITSTESAKQTSDGAATPTQAIGLALPQILLTIWLCGSAVCLCYFAALAYLLKKSLAKSPVAPSLHLLTLFQQVKDELGIRTNLEVLCQDGYGTPAQLFPRTVFLPMRTLALMNDEQIRNCLRHECMHYKRGDHVLNLLLLLLNAVYWFNPIIWLAFFQIRRDMESACDSAVVRRMNPSARRDYATLILGMFSQEKQRQIALGMVQGNTRKIAEERIRGIFMKNNSGKSVRFMAAMVAIVLFVCCFTTACQPTPETPPVINKADNHLEDMIASSAASEIPSETPQGTQNLSTALMTALGVPESINETYTNDKGDITVTIDAKAEIPSVDSLPAIEAIPASFTQEQVDRLAVYFLKGAQVYTEDRSVLTKSEIQQQIINAQKQIEDAKNTDGTAFEGQTEKTLKQLQEQYATAPEERERKPATTELNKAKSGSELEVYADMGKDTGALFRVGNVSSSGYTGSSLLFSNIGNGFYAAAKDQTAPPRDMTMLQQDAEKLVMQCISDLGIGDMRIGSVQVGTFNQYPEAGGEMVYYSGTEKENPDAKQCYLFTLERMVHGIPVLDIVSSTPMDTDDPSVPAPKEPEYTNVMDPEYLTITVDDTGIIEFNWRNPAAEQSIMSEHVSLMNFSDILVKAKDNTFYKNYTAYGSKANIKITRVALSMMRIMEKDKPGQYLIVPVWDFIGTREDIMEDGNSSWLGFGDQSYVTINAIDGSSINRAWGY